MPAGPAPIVVGYDGSPSSRYALHWAVQAADRDQAPLLIVQALDLAADPSLPLVAAVRRSGVEIIAERIRIDHPSLKVSAELTEGAAGPVLLAAAKHARLIVLGSRGLGGWSELLVGSVAVQVLSRATCPVVVMTSSSSPDRAANATVVLGVDGSTASVHAVDFAFDQAESMGARLVVLHAWMTPFLSYPHGLPALQFDEQRIIDNAQLMVSETVAGAAADHPDLAWTTLLVSGSAAEWLVRLSESADLVVVGSRGRGGFAGLLLGSVSRHLLHHAQCPTAVVR